jgi:hypothetical protein
MRPNKKSLVLLQAVAQKDSGKTGPLLKQAGPLSKTIVENGRVLKNQLRTVCTFASVCQQHSRLASLQ